MRMKMAVDGRLLVESPRKFDQYIRPFLGREIIYVVSNAKGVVEAIEKLGLYYKKVPFYRKDFNIIARDVVGLSKRLLPGSVYISEYAVDLSDSEIEMHEIANSGLELSKGYIDFDNGREIGYRLLWRKL